MLMIISCLPSLLTNIHAHRASPEAILLFRKFVLRNLSARYAYDPPLETSGLEFEVTIQRTRAGTLASKVSLAHFLPSWPQILSQPASSLRRELSCERERKATLAITVIVSAVNGVGAAVTALHKPTPKSEICRHWLGKLFLSKGDHWDINNMH